jgi:hypothetical protein
MEYRNFEYTNGDGQVQLERGSSLGVAVSWVILKALNIALLLVVAGLGFSVFKYFEPSLAFDTTPAAMAHFAHTALQAFAPG